jgi:triacylglycerol lipase
MKRFNQICGFLLASLSTQASSPSEMKKERVVMVHGIFQSGHCFYPLKKRLEKAGHDCLVPSLIPADARSGIETLADQLRIAIEEKWGKDADFHIVAHSMGGLISRYYLQELGGHEHCHSLITLATPHHGTSAAYLYPGKGAVQMRPRSEFLQQLELSEDRLANVTLISYRTPLDLIILPSTSSHWELAQNHKVWAPAHPLVLYSPRVQRHIFNLLGKSADKGHWDKNAN